MTDHEQLRDLGTVLTVWAHPDDEAYLAGGLLALLADAGRPAVCVTATRGEAADPGAGPGERAALGALRARELEGALGVLGVREHRWLDHADGSCADADPEQAAKRLACVLDEFRPDTVVSFGPDGFTGHPDHRAVGAWADRAVRRASGSPRLLHAAATPEDLARARTLGDRFGVYDLGLPRVCTADELALRLALDGDVLDRKVEALLLQESQTAGLVSEVGRARFREWVAVECFAAPSVTR
jgi:LmbE family N-acetylglucosaminyl deacetylase